MNCYPFIEAEKQGDHNVKRACELLQVSRSAYYADCASGPSVREQRDAELTGKIIEIHDESSHTYGSPRVHRELRSQGERCSRKRVVRLMRAADRHGRIPRRWKKTTIPDPDAPTRPDLIGRDFGIDLDQPGQLDRRRCGDITYIHTWQGWLYLALLDRYDGMWVLAATTGMRRSELAGVERQGVDLENGVLMIEDTRVVVAGRAQASDGKSEASQREISLDAFTVRHLKRFIDQMNQERKDFGRRYPNHDYLMAGPEGRPLHPDTITARFNRLVDRAGVPRIRLHDVRHTYATLAQDAGHNIKTLSERIGHADVTVTGKIYTHKSRGTDRVMADAMGAMIERLAAQNEASETGRGSEVG